MRRTSRLFKMSMTMFLIFLLAGCGATPLQSVDPVLTGTWQGECEIGLPVVFNPNQIPEGVEPTRTIVPFELTIHEDASVEGMIGDASIEESILKRNRGEVGRRLNLATDYIIISNSRSQR